MAPGQRHNVGFTLLEVIISISLLLVLTLAVSAMLRSGFDLRFALAQESAVTHRMGVAMQHVVSDVEHAFILSKQKDIATRFPVQRLMKPLFKIERQGDSAKLWITSMGHKPVNANSHEGDVTLVVYEVREAHDASGRKNLYRGEFPRFPDDSKDDPPFRLLARHIKALKVKYWNGEQFVDDSWDNTRAEWRDKMPYMLSIEIEGWTDDPAESGSGSSTGGALSDATVTLKTICYLALAQGYGELKQGTASVRWEQL